MPVWPHEYLVRDRVNEKDFEALVCHIRAHGFQGRFYQKPITYFAEDGLLYWTMGAPIEITTIINRCKEEDSYENRLRNGTLPPKLKSAPEAKVVSFYRRQESVLVVAIQAVTSISPRSYLPTRMME